MKEIYVRPTTSVRPIYMEEGVMLKSSDLGISEASEAPTDISGPVTGDGIDAEHYDAWGDVKAQHSWGDDPF